MAAGADLMRQMLMGEPLPEGYRLIDVPDGTEFDGENLAPFAIKATPKTNENWGAFVASLGRDRFVLLYHNRGTGETTIRDRGHGFQVRKSQSEPQWNIGEIMMWGSLVAAMMPENPSKQYDDGQRIFSGERQRVVGLTYFHMIAWGLLQTLLAGGDRSPWIYTLPTDAQFHYIVTVAKPLL